MAFNISWRRTKVAIITIHSLHLTVYTETTGKRGPNSPWQPQEGSLLTPQGPTHTLLEAYYCCSVTKLCPTLCDPMDCSMPGFPVSHYLLEFAPTHVHWVSDAIQPSHPLLPPSPPALSLSQHQGLFQWVGSSHFGSLATLDGQSIGPSASASVLPMNIQGWFPLGLTGLISKGLSRVFSSTTSLWRPMDLSISNQSTSLFFKWGQWSWERLDDFSKVSTSRAQQHPNLQTAVTVLTAALSSMP